MLDNPKHLNSTRITRVALEMRQAAVSELFVVVQPIALPSEAQVRAGPVSSFQFRCFAVWNSRDNQPDTPWRI